MTFKELIAPIIPLLMKKPIPKTPTVRCYQDRNGNFYYYI